MISRYFSLGLLLTLMFPGSVLAKLNQLTILQYHHVSENTPRVTSLSPAEFDQHMDYLKEQGFHPIHLSKALTLLKNKKTLPERSIAITFDDGFKNLLDHAIPRLEDLGWPYTVFVNPELINQSSSQHMTWIQLKKLMSHGAEIANHTMAHDHLIRQSPDESTKDYAVRIEKDILQAEAQIQRHLGQSLKMLAYPYGEFNPTIEEILIQHGFWGIAQFSGVANEHTSPTRIPRFPASGIYARMSTLKTKIDALAPSYEVVQPQSPQLDGSNTKPELKVRLLKHDFYSSMWACYLGTERIKPQWLNDDEFSVKPTSSIPIGRSRFNCTAPSKTFSGRFYWLSHPWFNPKPDGSWYKE